jgi:hypothetical protein
MSRKLKLRLLSSQELKITAHRQRLLQPKHPIYYSEHARGEKSFIELAEESCIISRRSSNKYTKFSN